MEKLRCHTCSEGWIVLGAHEICSRCNPMFVDSENLEMTQTEIDEHNEKQAATTLSFVL